MAKTGKGGKGFRAAAGDADGESRIARAGDTFRTTWDIPDEYGEKDRTADVAPRASVRMCADYT